MSITKLTLKNMVFYGHHGVFAVEKELGQRIEVDVELTAEFECAGKSDNLELTINYVDVYNLVKEIVTGSGFNLIEGIGVAILDQITARYNLEQVTVRVRKPYPPIGGLIDVVEFEISSEPKKLVNSGDK